MQRADLIAAPIRAVFGSAESVDRVDQRDEAIGNGKENCRASSDAPKVTRREAGEEPALSGCRPYPLRFENIILPCRSPPLRL